MVSELLQENETLVLSTFILVSLRKLFERNQSS